MARVSLRTLQNYLGQAAPDVYHFDASDYELIKDAIQDGTAGINTEALEIGGTEAITTTRGGQFTTLTVATTANVGNLAVGGELAGSDSFGIFGAGTTSASSLRVMHGVAPTSPVNGDIWTTTAGLYVRINGATVGPVGSAPVDSVFGRTGAVVATANDYTWAQVDKTTSSLADITTRSAGDLSSGTLAHERGGLEADVSAYAGLVKISGGATSALATSANGESLITAADYAAMKTLLTLNNVENTALSTWAGTANITTLGTIGTGTWQGSVVDHERGGLEADVNAYNGLIRISGGATSNITDLAGLNTALGSSIADGAHTTSASDLSSGTLADARLSSNVPLINGAPNVWTGTQSFAVGAANAPSMFFTGSASGFYANATSQWGWTNGSAVKHIIANGGYYLNSASAVYFSGTTTPGAHDVALGWEATSQAKIFDSSGYGSLKLASVEMSSGGAKFLGKTTTAAAPTTTEYPSDGDFGIHENTTGPTWYWAYNDGGTIYSVQLT